MEPVAEVFSVQSEHYYRMQLLYFSSHNLFWVMQTVHHHPVFVKYISIIMSGIRQWHLKKINNMLHGHFFSTVLQLWRLYCAHIEMTAAEQPAWPVYVISSCDYLCKKKKKRPQSAAVKRRKQSVNVWQSEGTKRLPSAPLPVAREDLLRHLDGDVTLLPPLVEIQQVGSQARGRLGNGACGEDEIMRTDRMRVTQMGRVWVCDKNINRVFLRVCCCFSIFVGSKKPKAHSKRLKWQRSPQNITF